jgi:hypothetical protein
MKVALASGFESGMPGLDGPPWVGPTVIEPSTPVPVSGTGVDSLRAEEKTPASKTTRMTELTQARVRLVGRKNPLSGIIDKISKKPRVDFASGNRTISGQFLGNMRMK